MQKMSDLGRLLLVSAAATATLTCLVASPASADTGMASPPAAPSSAEVAASSAKLPGGDPATAPTKFREAMGISGSNYVCAQAHIQNFGWQQGHCSPGGEVVTVGLPGQGLQMEALSLRVYGSAFCAEAHVQSIGWQGRRCSADSDVTTVGTEGQGLGMEAVSYGVNSGTICGNAYLQDIGWQGWNCAADGGFTGAGTTGQNRRMEAMAFYVLDGAGGR